MSETPTVRKQIKLNGNSYELIERLKINSGEADLFLIRNEAGRKFIFKYYRFDVNPKEEVIERLRNVASPSVIKIFETGRTGEGRFYELQEYAEFGSLADYIKNNRPLPHEFIRSFIADLNRCFHEIHSSRIIHRDIKPSNILIKNLDPLKLVLIDFGISSMSEASMHQTSFAGTYLYIPPESASISSDDRSVADEITTSKAADYWAMGIIIVEMLAGRHPYDGINSLQTLFHKFKYEPIPHIEKIDDAFSNIAKGLLTRDPKKRWGFQEIIDWSFGKTDIEVHFETKLPEPSEIRTAPEKSKSVKPYFFDGNEYYDPASLAMRMAANWNAALADFKGGKLREWLRLEVRDGAKVFLIDSLMKEKMLTDDERLFDYIYRVAGQREIIFQGKLITRQTLKEISARVEDKAATAEEIIFLKDVIYRNIVQKYFEIVGDEKGYDEFYRKVCDECSNVLNRKRDEITGVLKKTDKEEEEETPAAPPEPSGGGKTLSVTTFAFLLIVLSSIVIYNNYPVWEWLRGSRGASKPAGSEAGRPERTAAVSNGNGLAVSYNEKTTEPAMLIEALIEVNPENGTADPEDPENFFKTYDVLHLYFNKPMAVPERLNLAESVKNNQGEEFEQDNEVRNGTFRYYDGSPKYPVAAPAGIPYNLSRAPGGKIVAGTSGDGTFGYGTASNEIVIRYPAGKTGFLIPGRHFINLTGAPKTRNVIFRERSDRRDPFGGKEGVGAVASAKPVLIKKYDEAAVPKCIPSKPLAVSLKPDRLVSVDIGGGVSIDFMNIPAGKFQMGDPANANMVESPAHPVNITRDFYIGIYEITQKQWNQIMENNPGKFKGEADLPVESVSWDDCQAFIAKLNQGGHSGGLGEFRLPTEAEWEYSCRAGSAAPYYWGDVIDEAFCWHNDNSDMKTHLIGQKFPNSFGLCDMSGNVYEWCGDWFAQYSADEATDPAGPSSGSERVIRGGYFGGSDDCRSSSRYFKKPSEKAENIGFRLVISPKKSSGQ